MSDRQRNIIIIICTAAAAFALGYLLSSGGGRPVSSVEPGTVVTLPDFDPRPSTPAEPEPVAPLPSAAG